MMYNFDKITDRHNTGSYKWDSAENNDVIPLWVADMDFQTAPCVIEALRKRVEHGVFGYTLVDNEYYASVCRWFKQYHDYVINPDMILYTLGVVPAVSAIIKALVPAGSGVIVQTPVYNCFFSSIRNNGCRVVENKFLRRDLSGQEFTYDMDFEGLESLASDPLNKMLLLCNPHNPAGRVWSRGELETVMRICMRNNVVVVSDEIHCELTLPDIDYVSYGTVDKDSVVCLSPSKAFNTAGLQIANIVCPNADVKAQIDRAININEVCDVNPFGVVGLKAAYTDEGRMWLDELRHYIKGNYHLVKEYIRHSLPQFAVTRLEATYLPWIDISSIGISSHMLEDQLKQKAGVWVNSGEMYGAEGYVRLNIACPRMVLAEGLRRFVEGINNLV
ncbi:MalY/PatB family protein [uncultured Muribaculum sp.]|uniref:MalY/PatB family protein n=1 Tax=uncultured Muribaculum sp. TaxID=1918613 RepID=UPI0025B675BA|nr:MalY/PatB family protein [uncultured Muribaculum sp.]